MLEQGLPPPEASASTVENFPSPLHLAPSLLATPSHPIPHTFPLPTNTTGQASVRLPVPQLILMPNIPTMPSTLPTSPSPVSTPPVHVPYSTKSYRKKKLQEEETGVLSTKRYRQRTGPATCSKCGQPRTGDHKQFFGNWYCPKTSTETYEQWREKFGDKYKKNKNKV